MAHGRFALVGCMFADLPVLPESSSTEDVIRPLQSVFPGGRVCACLSHLYPRYAVLSRCGCLTGLPI